jgi:hypothetical protein
MPWELIIGPAILFLVIGIMSGLKEKDKIDQRDKQ